MNRRRTGSRGTAPTTKISPQPPRLLIVHIAAPSWAHICPNLCEALQNFFSIACNLMGPSRMSLFSLYTVQNQHECVLPFVQVRGNFVRLQTCISELRMLQVEGCYRPHQTSLPLAVEDGLQQFKQFSRYMATSATQPSTSLEITVLTSQPGKEVIRQLEEGLKDINLLCVRRLQVVEIPKDTQENRDSPSPIEEPSNDESALLEADIVLQTLDNDVVSMEVFFKAWLHNSETDREHIHLLLAPQSLPPSSTAKDNPMCLKCDLHERFLSPSLLPGTADGTLRTDDPKGDISTLYQMASLSPDSPCKLQVIKALKSSGICESLTYGLPFILRPTSCWKLDWDELETNQQHFHALCHCLLSTLDGLELGATYNPLQVDSYLYSHLSNTYAKPQGRLSTSRESRGLRKGGQTQTNRVRTTVVPLTVAPAPGRAPKTSAANKTSSGTFLPSDSEEEYPSQT
ncbi:meiosis 1 arrest protein isoform X2 [Alexandromys fortis]|uniref:meiosis 1 arrest protein isoform X2 n=1 Tax=Alexandromys fortis TaxID=100897 RepID=UPI0021522614|nr:meiosis 1 arrest protein isoform X2 [Microtus fortis]